MRVADIQPHVVIERPDEGAGKDVTSGAVSATASVPQSQGVCDSTHDDLNAQTREGVIRLAEYLRLKRGSEKGGLTRKARALRAYLKSKSLVAPSFLSEKKQGAKLKVIV